MTNKKTAALKRLIQKAELEKPQYDFTNLIMEEIEAQEPVINPALKTLIKRNGIEKPSINLRYIILTQIEESVLHTKHKPIIPQKAWLIVISMIVFFVIYLGFSEQSLKSPEGLTLYFISIGNILSTILNVNSVPPLYLIIFISISVLLAMDYLLRIKWQNLREK